MRKRAACHNAAAGRVSPLARWADGPARLVIRQSLTIPSGRALRTLNRIAGLDCAFPLKGSARWEDDSNLKPSLEARRTGPKLLNDS